jgi:undecaprenyl-diphosphatase
LEIRLVRLFAPHTLLGRRSAVFVSRCGNGWIYPVLATIFIVRRQGAALRPLVAAAISIAILHCFYPLLKTRFGRSRPYEVVPELHPLFAPLDPHSFPSGHAMTLTAALVPFAMAFSGTIWSAATIWAAMAWARVASGHHFPTDILGGTVLGAGVAYPIAIWIS